MLSEFCEFTQIFYPVDKDGNGFLDNFELETFFLDDVSFVLEL